MAFATLKMGSLSYLPRENLSFYLAGFIIGVISWYIKDFGDQRGIYAFKMLFPVNNIAGLS